MDEEIRFIPFKASHAYSMDWKDKDEFCGLIAGQPQYFYSLEAMRGALTVVKGNPNHPGYLILGILVITPINPKHCSVLIYMSMDYIGEFGKDLYKVTQRVIDDLCVEYVRVSAEIKTDNKKLVKFMGYLGFEEDGVMRKYGYNGEDYSLYAIITDKEAA